MLTVPSRCRPFGLFVVVIVVLAGCSGGGGGSTPTGPLGLTTSQVELTSYGLVNNARSDNAVEPLLDLREALSEIAREHSASMRDDGYFGHRDSLGRMVGDRLAEAGISYRVAAENLAMVTNSPTPAAWVHDRLMASPEHRPNILNPNVELIGVGVATDGSTYWLTQIFVGQ